MTNKGNDRSHPLQIARAAKAETGATEMTALADHGYYDGEQIRACQAAGITPMVPRPNTSPAPGAGLWGKPAFTYEPETDTYRCPMGEQLQNRFERVEAGKLIRVTFTQKACAACASRTRCVAGREKRIRRWEHEAVLDAMQARLARLVSTALLRRPSKMGSPLFSMVWPHVFTGNP